MVPAGASKNPFDYSGKPPYFCSLKFQDMLVFSALIKHFNRYIYGGH
jgi:hypothetical protein